MRIIENTPERLVLKGTPGSVHWMLFCTLLGVAAMTAAVCFGWVTVREIGGYLQLVPLGIGFLMGAAFFGIGVVTLAIGRVRLVLDRVTGEGNYEVCSPVIDVGKPCTFCLESVDSVELQQVQEARPHQGERASFPANVCRARLRVRSPRRAIVMAETENGREARVREVAHEVADWLGVEVV